MSPIPSRPARQRRDTERIVHANQTQAEKAAAAAIKAANVKKRADKAARLAALAAACKNQDALDDIDDEPVPAKYSLSSARLTTRMDKPAAVARIRKVPQPLELTDDENVEHTPRLHKRKHVPAPQSSDDDTGDMASATENDNNTVTANATDSDNDSNSNTSPGRVFKGGKPKAKDFDGDIQEVLPTALHIYRCMLSTVNAFPEHLLATQMARTAWKSAIDTLQVTPIPLTPRITQVILARKSQLRGEVKHKVAMAFGPFYGFKTGHPKKTTIRNRRLAKELKTGMGYAYQTIRDSAGQGLETRLGLYKSKFISDVVCAVWFSKSTDEGVSYSSYFNPLTIENLALVLTAIECCVDEWVTGSKESISFTTVLYRDIYLGHVKELNKFKAYTTQKERPDVLPTLLKKLHDVGRFHSGAEPLNKKRNLGLNVSEFQNAIAEFDLGSTTESDSEVDDINEEDQGSQEAQVAQ